MNNETFLSDEPYRFFFPWGTFFLFWGTCVWLPQLWNSDSYPMELHRSLMINGFSASFIAGFLMTAVPRFSQTEKAIKIETLSFFLVTILNIFFSLKNFSQMGNISSALQGIILFTFLLRRILKRKANPPYSFVFIFLGLLLWIIPEVLNAFGFNFPLQVHYEASIAAIILGVGSRLIPGILGHTDIVQIQRAKYENEKPFLQTLPTRFIIFIAIFTLGAILNNFVGSILKCGVFLFIAFFYWKLQKAPKEKTTLSWSIWTTCWAMVFSYVLKVLWPAGDIHITHAFFFSGTLLLTLLVAIRVLQSHGPKDKALENKKIIYFIAGLTLFAGATRVTAILLPESYLHHLGYSALLLSIALVIWSIKYLRFVRIKN
jgi:uncharacterized protein involved in response to NO